MKVKDETTDDKGMIRVFVYGTLKQGHANHRLLEAAKAKFIGYDSVTGPYRMYDMGSFPAVLDRTDLPAAPMKGELWAMNPEGLAALDMLEGNPHFYARRKLWTDHLKKRAWMYFLTDGWKDEAGEDDEIEDYLWNPEADEAEFWVNHDV